MLPVLYKVLAVWLRNSYNGIINKVNDLAHSLFITFMDHVYYIVNNNFEIHPSPKWQRQYLWHSKYLATYEEH